MNLNIGYLSSLFIGTYLIAAIPFGIVISRLKGINLREVGSGNIGATNVYRALGWKYALAVFLLDGFKGWLPTFLIIQWESVTWLHITIGFIAIVGHSLSCFVKFKGGKGAATGIGVILALSPKICFIVILIAFGLIFWKRYVSLATIVCSLITPALFYYFKYPIPYTLFLLLISVFIIVRHQANIIRLIRGTENKI